MWGASPVGGGGGAGTIRVILCSPGKKQGEIKAAETLVENAQTKGWQYVGLQGDAHIFMAPMEAEPIFSSPGRSWNFPFATAYGGCSFLAL